MEKMNQQMRSQFFKHVRTMGKYNRYGIAFYIEPVYAQGIAFI